METTHKIIKDLIGNAQLHRFINDAGIPYSAIYQDGREVWSCEYEGELQMLIEWANMQNKTDIPEGYKVNPDLYEIKSRRMQLIVKPSLYEKLRYTADRIGTSLNSFCHKLFEDAVY